MTCGPGHYIGAEEGERIQSMADHAVQAHSKAATPHKDCETCRLQVQYDEEADEDKEDDDGSV